MHGPAPSSHRLTTRGDKASWHIPLDIESGVDLENLILSFGDSLRCPRGITDTFSHTCSDGGLYLWQGNLAKVISDFPTQVLELLSQRSFFHISIARCVFAEAYCKSRFALKVLKVDYW